MTIKSILCIYGGSHGELNVLESAFSVGKRTGAHICFLHLSPNISSYVSGYQEQMLSIASAIEEAERGNEERMEIAREQVFSAAKQHSVSSKIEGSFSVEFKHQIGMENAAISEQGRLSDLIIIGRQKYGTNPLYEDAMIASLFRTGSPVLVLPPQNPVLSQWDKAISFAWNGSLESAQALRQSMPLMTQTQKIHVLMLREGKNDEELQDMEDNLISYMKRHNIQPDVTLVECGSYHSKEAALLGKARELGSDLLVMGAYGHSRFSETLFGGMTNYMLKHADIPLLMSH